MAMSGVRGQGAPVGMPGLQGAVRITTDRWGIPHVDAAGALDAFAGQGYAQARMRLFQIELWRRVCG
jgi:penicillin amidase